MIHDGLYDALYDVCGRWSLHSLTEGTDLVHSLVRHILFETVLI